jgi:hypothetical protein
MMMTVSATKDDKMNFVADFASTPLRHDEYEPNLDHEINN